MNQETKQWLDMADMDLGVAKYLMENYYPKPLEIICYHSQQAAEKAIQYADEIMQWVYELVEDEAADK